MRLFVCKLSINMKVSSILEEFMPFLNRYQIMLGYFHFTFFEITIYVSVLSLNSCIFSTFHSSLSYSNLIEKLLFTFYSHQKPNCDTCPQMISNCHLFIL